MKSKYWLLFVCSIFILSFFLDLLQPAQAVSENGEKSDSHFHDHDGSGHHDEERSDRHKDESHDDDHGGQKAIGRGKAIAEVDEKKGFRLSDEAIQTLGVQMQVVSPSTFLVPHSAIVLVRDTTGLYRVREGFFKFIEVSVLKEKKGLFLIRSNGGFAKGDRVVVKSAPLIRTTDVYSTDTSEYGHGH